MTTVEETQKAGSANRTTGRKKKFDPNRYAQLPNRTGKDLSKAYIRQELVLNSTIAQQIYDRTYIFVENGLYSISVVLRIITSPQDAQVVHNSIDRVFTETIGQLRQASAQLEVMAASQGVEFGEVGYTNPVSFEVQVSSPKAVRYIAILRELDQVLMKLDTCWIAGMMSDDEHSNQAFGLKKIVMKASGEISKLNTRAMRAARDKKTLSRDVPNESADSAPTSEEGKTNKVEPATPTVPAPTVAPVVAAGVAGITPVNAVAKAS